MWLQSDEQHLSAKLTATQTAVHTALSDNVNTAAALDALADLIKATNVYLAHKQVGAGAPGGGLWARGTWHASEGVQTRAQLLCCSPDHRRKGVLARHCCWAAAVLMWHASFLFLGLWMPPRTGMSVLPVDMSAPCHTFACYVLQASRQQSHGR